MEKSIYERLHEAIRAYLRHRGVEILEESWEHDSDSIDFIAMDDGKIVFADTATKCGGCDVPKEEPDQKRFERITEAYLAEAEVEDLTSIRYDIASLLVTGSKKALLRHHKNTSQQRKITPNATAPDLQAQGRASTVILLYAFSPYLISFGKVSR